MAPGYSFRSMRARAMLLVVATIVASAGCVAPGSAIRSLALSGTFDPATSSDANIRLTVTLAKTYGLGGLDHLFGKPEDYGREISPFGAMSLGTRSRSNSRGA